jgi:hypothetical protein
MASWLNQRSADVRVAVIRALVVADVAERVIPVVAHARRVVAVAEPSDFVVGEGISPGLVVDEPQVVGGGRGKGLTQDAVERVVGQVRTYPGGGHPLDEIRVRIVMVDGGAGIRAGLLDGVLEAVAHIRRGVAEGAGRA